MSSDETNYYRSRAQAERSLALSSSDSTVAAIHEKMAGLYGELIAITEPQQECSVLPFKQAMRT